MIKLFSDKAPSLLLDGYIIQFGDGYNTGEVAKFGGRYYKVKNPQQVRYTRYYIIPDSDYIDVNLSNASSGTENLYPYQANELNEILLGIEADGTIVYPIIPAPDRYFQQLGYTGMIPSITDSTKRYLGCLTQDDTTKDNMRFRMCFVKDEDPMVLRCYVDSGQSYEKILLHFLVNRCTISKLDVPTESQKAKARRILRYSELKKGGGM